MLHWIRFKMGRKFIFIKGIERFIFIFHEHSFTLSKLSIKPVAYFKAARKEIIIKEFLKNLIV